MNESLTVSSEPKGIGGWLVLVAIGLIVSPIRLAYSIIVDYLPQINSSEWATLNFPAFKNLFYGELVINSLFVVFAIVLLVLFFSEDRRFPKYMIAFYIANLTFVIADFAIASFHPLIRLAANPEGGIMEVVRSVAAAAIWIPYFLVSQRVKNTFV